MSYLHWLRRQIGHRKTILVYSTVVAQDQTGRILLQRRSDFAWWGLPGGILEFGESIAECARRELAEETGLSMGTMRLVGIYSHPRYDVTYPNGDESQQFTVCFAGQATGGRLRPDGEETRAVAFKTLAELAALDIPPWYRQMIADTAAVADPTFEWDGALDDHTQAAAPDDELYRPAGSIAPAALAVVQREDGSLFVARDDAGAPVLPLGPMKLGEPVAATAVRVAKQYGLTPAVPRRLLGVVSLPGSLSPGSTWTGHMVAGVFLLAVQDTSAGWSTNGEWVAPRHVPVLLGAAQARWADLLIEALNGVAFVDDRRSGDV